MVQQDVHACKPCLNKLECGQNTVDDLQELVTISRECFGLPGASIKALPEDEFSEIARNACLMELLAQPSLNVTFLLHMTFGGSERPA